jgi:hypothetical protein
MTMTSSEQRDYTSIFRLDDRKVVTVCSTPAAFTSATTTLAPNCARAMLEARPRPLPPPTQ